MEETSKDKSDNEDNPSDSKVADESKKVVSKVEEIKLKSDTESMKGDAIENVVSESTSSDISQKVSKAVEAIVSTEVSEESLGISEKTACPKLVEAAIDEMSVSVMEVDEKSDAGSSKLADESLLAKSASARSAKSMETTKKTDFTDRQPETETENEEVIGKLKKPHTDAKISTADPEKVEEFPSPPADLSNLAGSDDFVDSDDGSQKIQLVFDESDNENVNCQTRTFKENVMVKISGDILPGGKLDDSGLLEDQGSEEDLDLDAEMSESEILDSIEDVIGSANVMKYYKSEKETASTEPEKIRTDLEVQPSAAHCNSSIKRNENVEPNLNTDTDTKDNRSDENNESNTITPGETASKSTEDLQLSAKGEVSTLAPEEQKVVAEPETESSKPAVMDGESSGSTSMLADPDDLVEVEDALGLLAEAKPREEEEDENVGDDEDDEDDLEDDEGLEGSHHGSSEVESGTQQMEEDTDGLQYECSDSQYFTETEQSIDNMAGLDQDGEGVDFEGGSGMGFIQSVSTVSVPMEEFEATKDEGDTPIKIKREKIAKLGEVAERAPTREEGELVQEEESLRMDETESEKMIEDSDELEELPGETDGEIDIGEEMLILEGKVISSEEFFGTLTSEMGDIASEEKDIMEEKKVDELAEMEDLENRNKDDAVSKDDKVQEEMDVDAASAGTGDHEKEILEEKAESTLEDGEDTEMVSEEEDGEKVAESKDAPAPKASPERESQLEEENSASQEPSTDEEPKDVAAVIVESKETPEKVKEVEGTQEISAVTPDDTEKLEIVPEKPADLPEIEDKAVDETLEADEKMNDTIEASIPDKAKPTVNADKKTVSENLDENSAIPLDQEDKSKISDSDTVMVEPKDSDADSKVIDIVEKSAEVPEKEAIARSDQSSSVASASGKRKTKVLSLSRQDNVQLVLDIVDLEESSSDSDDIVEVPTTLKEAATRLEEQQREKSSSTVPATAETKEQDQSKPAEQVSVTDVDNEVKKKTDEEEKKIHKEERKKKHEEASKHSGYAISKEAIPMPAPPVAGISTEDKANDEVTATSDERPAKSALPPSVGEEVFSLDSDNDFADFDDVDRIIAPISKLKDSTRKMTAIDLQKVKAAGKCVNYACASEPATATYRLAPMFVLSHYREARTKRYKQYVCEPCLDEVSKKMESLVDDVRQMKPLKLHDDIPDVVLISDSDDDSDMEDALESTGEKLSQHNVEFLEEHLADMINSTWKKYKMEEQVSMCEEDIKMQLARLEKESLEVDELFEVLQRTTDLIRNDLYDSFAGDRQELPELEIVDTDASKTDQLSEEVKAASVGRKSSQDDDEWTPSIEPGAERRSSEVSTDTEMRRSTRKRKSIPNYSLIEEDGLPVDDKTPVPATAAAQDGKRVLQKRIENMVEMTDDVSPIEKQPSLTTKQSSFSDDNADITVVESARETAPAGLPPPGDLVRAELREGDLVYAVRQSTFGAWLQARVLEVWPKGTELSSGNPCMFTICKVRFEHKLKGTAVKQLTGRQLAYPEPANVRLPIGTRVIAIFKDPGNNYKKESYYSGVVAEMPNPVNSYRYLVFFDDGYAQYVTHAHTLAVCECSVRVWEDVHPDSRDFVRKYLASYPERPMVRLQPGQALKTEWSGKWWVSHVLAVDASLVQVRFDVDGRAEWIYRGSTRLAPLFLELQAAERHRPRGLTRTTKSNMPYVEYTRLDQGDTEIIDMTGGDTDKAVVATKQQQDVMQKRQDLSMAAQRAVAKKSVTITVPAPVPAATPYPLPDNVLSRVVYYSPKAAVKPHKMVPHMCSAVCQRGDVLPLRELRTYNPLVRPLLVGWERMIHRFKGKKVVLYRAPCGRRLRDMAEMHRYLRAVQSDMSVDLFDFHPEVHCLAEFVLGKCYVSKKRKRRGWPPSMSCVRPLRDRGVPYLHDISHGMENIPVPCVNYYDASLPEFCTYSTVRTPTDGVPLNLDSDFLCGCDCTDDCQDKTKCQCWKLTLAGARTIGMEGDHLGYKYKRLPEPLPSGIYECNPRCKCAMTCLNRVVQHPLQLKLQVFKTLNRGWGIRTLNDVPRGAFLCVYAGNLLTDAVANRDGITEGDEYLAELDYIEVVERMKEGYESDVPDDDKEQDKKVMQTVRTRPEEDEESEEEVETRRRRDDEEDVDFRPEFYTVSNRNSDTCMRLRKRAQKEKSDQDSDSAADTATTEKDKGGNIDPDDQFITISDDEEVREPSSFAAQAGLEDDEYVPKHRSVRSAFGKDEACYIMDAKVQGNLGRYLNHSCCPNVFVQNVFVDTHDPRFPWVAFFALAHVPAGTELTWNYNYDVGSVPSKVLYCACGAPNCRGRLL